MLPKSGLRGHASAQGWADVAHSTPGLPSWTPGLRPEKWATRVGYAEKVGLEVGLRQPTAHSPVSQVLNFLDFGGILMVL